MPGTKGPRFPSLRVVAGAAALLLLPSTGHAPVGRRGPASSTAQSEAAHFHHVHLNVTDPEESIDFYQKYFGANEVKYRGRSDGLFTEKSFILLRTVDRAPRSNLGSSVWHIGWAGVDGPQEFEWRTKQGIGVQTPVTPLGRNHYMYFWGPSREVIEVYTGSKNHRFEHVHLIVADVDVTTQWFVDNLGLTALRPIGRPRPASRTWSNFIRVDNVNLIIYGKPMTPEQGARWYPKEMEDEFVPTEGTAIDHIAFSYSDIEPVYERMLSAGAEIVRPLTTDEEYGLTGFFVRAPNKLLLEIVQEKPIPEGIWN